MSAPAPCRKVIAGRYEIDRELARGGMGTVYRVVERTTGRALALKQLREQSNLARALFEREYERLSRLSHPRIIRAYEFGVDDDGAFYTMELLEGRDLRELAPLPYRDACRHLRDVAFSLSLLHARGYVHRDVSPRNIRLDATGRAKLLDFGAMTTFGCAPEVIGTPTCIAPEALKALPLDARSDLFGLGAVAYWLLAGRHAYPAARLSDALQAWQEGVVPLVSWVPDLPEPLQRLVSALLSQNPEARPESALEVIDALDALIGGTPDREIEVERSFLTSLPLIGREQELAQIKSQLEALGTGRGTALLIEGEAGSGRSRLCREIHLMAQLSGCAIAVVDAALERGPYGVARALVAEVFRVANQAALRAGRRHSELEAWFPEFGGESGVRRNLIGGDLERQGRARVLQRLEEWLVELAENTRVALIVDNLDKADELSAAVLSTFAQVTRERAVYIVATRRSHAAPVAKAPVEAFAKASKKMLLRPFDAEQTAALTGALFCGDSRVGRFATWLYEVTAGNPLSCVEIARDLMERGVVRYVRGVWLLPAEFTTSEFPQSLSAALATRLDDLSGPASRMASALSIHDGPLPFDLLRSLAPSVSTAELRVALGELVARGVASESDRGFRLANTALSELVSKRISDADREGLHRWLGDSLLARCSNDVGAAVEAGWHMLRGGKESEGADVLARLAPEIERLVLGDAVGALEAASAIYERERRPEAQRVALRATLATLSLPVDWKLKRHAHPTLDDLARLLGVERAGQLAKVFGKKGGLVAGVGSAKLRYLVSRRAHAPEFPTLLLQFVSMLGSLAGVAVLCADAEELERLARYVIPFHGLGRNSPGRILGVVLERLLAQVQGREADAWNLTQGPNSHLQPLKGVTREANLRLVGGTLMSLGTMNAYRADSRALAIADELVRLGEPMYELFGHRLRMLHHAFRGESTLAAAHGSLIERFAMRGTSTWQVEVTLPVHFITPYALSGDVVGMKRVVGQLDRLATEIPSLRVLARASRAAYLARSGRAESAVDLFETVMQQMPPRRIFGWAFMAGIFAGCLNALGRHERALELCRERLSHVQPGDRAFTAHYLELERQLALAEANLGRASEGAARLDGLIAELRTTNHPLSLGLLYEARARVARIAGDQAESRRNLELMRGHFVATGNAVLIARCERHEHSAAPRMASRRDIGDDAVRELSSLRGSGNERSQRALALLMERSGAKFGYLYQGFPDALILAASSSAHPPPPGLTEAVQVALERLGAETSVEVEEETALVDPAAAQFSSAQSPSPGEDGGEAPDIHSMEILRLSVGDRTIGAVALGRKGHTVVSFELLTSIALALDQNSSGALASPAAAPAEPGASAVAVHGGDT